MSASAGPPHELGVTDTILTQLADLGPPSGILDHAPSVAATTLGFDRVLLSTVTAGMLEARALHLTPTVQIPQVLAQLRERPVTLRYPLIEGEVMRRRRAQLIEAGPSSGALSEPGAPGAPQAAGAPGRAFTDVLGAGECVVAPIVLDGRVVGFLHADRESSGVRLDERDTGALTSFAICFGLIFERAVLRYRLRVQLEEMERFAGWASAQAGELGVRTVTLSEIEPATSGPRAGGPLRTGESALKDLLTSRELEVLRLMVRGDTNPGIARELVIAEGTVKYHVKNILRKLHASNRAEATSRYLRLTLHPTDGS